LKDIPGPYDTDLKGGIFHIRFSRHEMLPKPAEFRRIAQEAGLTYRGVEVEWEGMLAMDKGRWAFMNPVSQQKLVIYKGLPADTKRLIMGGSRVRLRAGEKDDSWEIVSFESVPVAQSGK
jgi:hypothetical protein